MDRKDMEELLKENLEECEGNEKFIGIVSTYKDWAFDDVKNHGDDDVKKHGLVVEATDGSLFCIDIEKVV